MTDVTEDHGRFKGPRNNLIIFLWDKFKIDINFIYNETKKKSSFHLRGAPFGRCGEFVAIANCKEAVAIRNLIRRNFSIQSCTQTVAIASNRKL